MLEKEMLEKGMLPSRFAHGPFVVLSDGSTYDGADDCAIAYLDDRGHQTLHECYEFKGVEDDQVVFVKISDLIDAYNKVHGTDL
jgi:hypothetical protein|tara:strand:- start:8552 stop:8803 length:252 start_codon:yes stop_codon:yes gene_type:complete